MKSLQIQESNEQSNHKRKNPGVMPAPDFFFSQVEVFRLLVQKKKKGFKKN